MKEREPIEVVLSDDHEFTMLDNWRERLALVFFSPRPRLIFEKCGAEGSEVIFESTEISTGVSFWGAFATLCREYEDFDYAIVLENIEPISQLNSVLAAEILEVYARDYC